jgi:glyoxylase-like metal-dependent hydrolase (beta-lactamase superfamily II)
MQTVTLIPSPELDPRIRILRCGSIVDTFALVTARYLVIVDTMISADAMQAGMALLAPDLDGIRTVVVLNTHGDWDHVCGNGIFCGRHATYPAPVIGSRGTAEIINTPEAAQRLVELQLEYPEDMATAEFWAPTVQYETGVTLDCGDLTLHAIPTPGHRPDHFGFWSPELRLLFAGDAAESPMPFVDDSLSVPVLRDSLRRMEELDPATVLYCHAPGRTDAGVIAGNSAYFDELEARCRRLLTQGGVGGGHGDLADAIGWPLEAALPDGMTTDTLVEMEPGFYREAHATAVRAMLGWLDRPVRTPPGE